MSNIADGTELKAILAKNLNSDLVETFMEIYPEAVAEWIHEAGLNFLDEYHGQAKDHLIYSIKLEPESTGAGIAEGIIEPAHYRLNIKASSGFLKTLEATFGLEVKNG